MTATATMRSSSNTTLFAALNVATGKVTARCRSRHRHEEFLMFLPQVARTYPGVELHLVMDNYAAHKHAPVQQWLTANPRVCVHASWPASRRHRDPNQTH